MFTKEYIDSLVLEVLKRMEIQGSEEKKRVLVALTGGDKNIGQVRLELEKIGKNYEVGVVLSERAKMVVPEDVYSPYINFDGIEEAMNFYRDSEAVLLPFLTKNTCAKLVGGILDTFPAYIVGKALLDKKEVIALYDSCRVAEGSLYARRLNGNIDELKEYGVTFLSSVELAAYILHGRKNTVRYMDAQKNILGVEDLGEFSKVDIVVGPDTIITPLARERAREREINFKTF